MKSKKLFFRPIFTTLLLWGLFSPMVYAECEMGDWVKLGTQSLHGGKLKYLLHISVEDSKEKEGIGLVLTEYRVCVQMEWKGMKAEMDQPVVLEVGKTLDQISFFNEKFSFRLSNVKIKETLFPSKILEGENIIRVRHDWMATVKISEKNKMAVRSHLQTNIWTNF